MHRNPFLAVKNPTTLIRSRISEKRIFEARFLCRQLGADIDPKEETALQQELENLVARVEELRQQARADAEAGLRARAESVYRDIERIAIDAPGLHEERAKLAGAEPLVARITGRTVPPKPEPATKPVEPRAKAEQREEGQGLAAAPSPVGCNWLPRPRLLVVGVGVFLLLILVVLFILFHGVQTPMPVKPEEGEQAILIRPLTTPSSSTAAVDNAESREETSGDSTVSGDTAVERPVARPGAVSVGSLQVEESAR